MSLEKERVISLTVLEVSVDVTGWPAAWGSVVWSSTVFWRKHGVEETAYVTVASKHRGVGSQYLL